MAALTDELLKMSEQLEALGGGDARIGACEAHVIVTPTLDDKGRSGVAINDKEVVLRDLRSGGQVDKKFKATNVFDDGDIEKFNEVVGEELLQWTLDGFSANVITYGQTDQGKTRALFRSEDHAGLAIHYMQQLYGVIGEEYQIGMSCWEVVDNDVLDLLSPTPKQPLPSSKALSYRTVLAPNFATAMSLMGFAWSLSPSWFVDFNKNTASPLANAGHFFCRVTLYNTEMKRLSMVHFVDLVGTQALSAKTSANFGAGPGRGVSALKKSKEDAKSKHQRRRYINQQLLSFTRTLTELSQLEPGASERTVSVRSTKLLQSLGPLLAGYYKTHLVACVSSTPSDHLDSVNTLRVASRATAIASPCVRFLEVQNADVGFVPAASVLPGDLLPDSDESEREDEEQEPREEATDMAQQQPVASDDDLNLSESDDENAKGDPQLREKEIASQRVSAVPSTVKEEEEEDLQLSLSDDEQDPAKSAPAPEASAAAEETEEGSLLLQTDRQEEQRRSAVLRKLVDEEKEALRKRPYDDIQKDIQATYRDIMQPKRASRVKTGNDTAQKTGDFLEEMLSKSRTVAQSPATPYQDRRTVRKERAAQAARSAQAVDAVRQTHRDAVEELEGRRAGRRPGRPGAEDEQAGSEGGGGVVPVVTASLDGRGESYFEKISVPADLPEAEAGEVVPAEEYRNILKLLKLSEKQHSLLKEKVKASNIEHEEYKQEVGLQLEDAKLEKLKARALVRSLGDLKKGGSSTEDSSVEVSGKDGAELGGDLGHVFQQYETEIGALNKEINTLRRKNADLMDKQARIVDELRHRRRNLDNSFAPPGTPLSPAVYQPPSPSGSSVSALIRNAQREAQSEGNVRMNATNKFFNGGGGVGRNQDAQLNTLRHVLKHAQTDNESLRKENEDLKRDSRRLAMRDRMLAEANKTIKKLTSQLAGAHSDLKSSIKSTSSTLSRGHELEEENAVLKKKLTHLRSDLAALMGDLRDLRGRSSDLKEKQLGTIGSMRNQIRSGHPAPYHALDLAYRVKSKTSDSGALGLLTKLIKELEQHDKHRRKDVARASQIDGLLEGCKLSTQDAANELLKIQDELMERIRSVNNEQRPAENAAAAVRDREVILPPWADELLGFVLILVLDASGVAINGFKQVS